MAEPQRPAASYAELASRWIGWAHEEADRIRKAKGLPPCTFKPHPRRSWRKVMDEIMNEPETPPAAPIALPPVIPGPLRAHALPPAQFAPSAPKFQLTAVLCACGCGTHMSNLSVNRGWQYVRGHKKGAGAIHDKVRPPAPRAPSPGKPTVTGMAQVQNFLRENEKLAEQQVGECHERLKALENEKRVLEHRVAVLTEQRKKYTVALEALGAA